MSAVSAGLAMQGSPPNKNGQPYTWLYFRSGQYAFSKDLRGYVLSPRGPYGYGPGAMSLWKPKK